MAFLGETFNVDDIPASTNNFELLPVGWYTAKITEASLGPNSKGTGDCIKTRFDITGPSHQGRCVFTYLNIKHQTPKTEEIGRQQLGDIMRAIGASKITDTDQLIGGDLQIKIGVQKGTGQYEDSNNVKGFKAIEGSRPPSMETASSEPSSSSTAPWIKN